MQMTYRSSRQILLTLREPSIDGARCCREPPLARMHGSIDAFLAGSKNFPGREVPSFLPEGRAYVSRKFAKAKFLIDENRSIDNFSLARGVLYRLLWSSLKIISQAFPKSFLFYNLVGSLNLIKFDFYREITYSIRVGSWRFRCEFSREVALDPEFDTKEFAGSRAYPRRERNSRELIP